MFIAYYKKSKFFVVGFYESSGQLLRLRIRENSGTYDSRGRGTGKYSRFARERSLFVCLFVCLFLGARNPSGPGPHHSRGF